MKKDDGNVPLSVELALARLIPGWPEARLCVALSGGVDSVTLLHVCHGIRATRPTVRLRAAHVHHGLQPAADEWQARCQALCARLEVPFDVLKLELSFRPGASIEAVARDARYLALQALLEPGEALLTAHHLDDQLETVLIQLFRGAGVAGLAAMPAATQRGHGLHVRPLLGVTRAAIEAYAGVAGLDWVEDPMNASQRFDRSLLRREITPKLRARWPSVARSVARSARHFAGALRLLDELAGLDAAGALDDGRLLISHVRALPRPRQANLLRWWLRCCGLDAPSTARLESILDNLIPARADAQPVVTWNSGEVRRHRDRLYAMQPIGRVANGTWTLDPGRTLAIEGVGTVTLVVGAGTGISAARFPGPFELRLRKGGERLLPAGQPAEKSVTRLLREADTEPWLRGRVPLIYSHGLLLAVGDLWIAAKAAAAPDEPSFAVRWTRSVRHNPGRPEPKV